MSGFKDACAWHVPGFSIAVFRMMFGVLWLDTALSKAPWKFSEGKQFGWLYGWIWQEVKHPTFNFYKAFLESVVLPNFTFFGYMTFFTEIALGISLLLGVFTVLGGIGGALWQVNIALGSFSVPGEWYWVWPLLIAPHLIFAHTRAGRILGIDALLHDRFAPGRTSDRAVGQLLVRLT